MTKLMIISYCFGAVYLSLILTASFIWIMDWAYKNNKGNFLKATFNACDAFFVQIFSKESWFPFQIMSWAILLFTWDVQMALAFLAISELIKIRQKISNVEIIVREE